MTRLFALAALAAVLTLGAAPEAPITRAAEPQRIAAAAGAKEFFFKPSDRIVFLGDSITMLEALQ